MSGRRILAISPLVALGILLSAAFSEDSQAYVWYAVRAAGIVSYLLLTIMLTLGLLLTTPLISRGSHRLLVFDLHRLVSSLILLFAGFHAAALLVDEFVGFSPIEVLVPFVSDYEPIGVGLGILALYLLVGIYLSFNVRQRIGFRMWRLIHYGGFLTFPLATYHAILIGSDSGAMWLLAGCGVCTLIVLAFAIYRFLTGEGIDEKQLRALETARNASATSGISQAS